MLFSSSNAGHFLTGDYTPTSGRTLAGLPAGLADP